MEYPILLTSLSHLLLSSILNHPMLSRSLPCEEVDLRVCLPLPLLWPKMGISFTAQSSCWFHNKEGSKERLRAKSKRSNSRKFFNDWLYSTVKSLFVPRIYPSSPISNHQYDIIAHKGGKRRREQMSLWQLQQISDPKSTDSKKVEQRE